MKESQKKKELFHLKPKMIVEKTQLDGVLKIKLDAFEDHRGWYVETYNEQKYREAGIDIKFVEDDISVTRKTA